jgi:hypothetical protein
MKKLFLIIGVVLFALVLFFSFVDMRELSPSGRQAKYFEELIAQKNDSLIMSAYLSGFNYAGKVEPLADSMAFLRIMEADLNPEILKCAFAVLEQTRGADSTAKMVYKSRRFDYDRHLQGWIRFGGSWQGDICAIERAMSPVLLEALKTIVLEKKDDPVWMSKYLSEEKMTELCLAGAFEEKKLIVYSSNLDSANSISVLEKFSDEIIIKYRIGSKVSYNRMMAIAEKMNFEDAYNFLVVSDASAKDIRALVIKNVDKLSGFEVLWFYAAGHLKDAKVRPLLRKMNTQQLAGDFPNRTNVYIWSFSYKEYGMEVIRSVKTKSDFYTASYFFQQTSDDDTQETWIDMLHKSKGSVII